MEKTMTYDEFMKGLNDDGRSQVKCLESIANKIQPSRILEIGSGWGLSAVAFLRNTNATMITIDPVENLQDFEQRTTSMGVRDRITRKIGRSGSNPSPKYKNDHNLVLDINEKFDLVYIDGCHRYQEVKEDLLNCWGKVKKEGVIILDDFFHKHNWTGKYGVTRAVSEVAKEKNKEYHVYPAAHGVVQINF
jgi:predicted O-methyltransferase YrrM